MQHKSLHFPRTNSPYFGELVSRFLRGELGGIGQVDPYLVAMLYAGDRWGASGTISSWLQEGNVVLLDRYVYSNVAYQCAKLNDSAQRASLREWILRLEYEHFAIPRPDVSIFLDVPFSFTASKLAQQREGADRSYLSGAKDIHEEDLPFQERVRGVYLEQLALDDRFSVVSCCGSDGSMEAPSSIFAQLWERVEPLLPK